MTSTNGHVNEVLLDVRGLTRVFGTGRRAVTAVDDVSFSIKPGELVAVVGESGSGKSTLARLLLRLLEPSAGTFTLNGVEATRLKGRHLKRYWQEVQAVFQDPFSSFNQFFNVQHLLERSGDVLEHRPSAADRRRRIGEALGRVGLTDDVLRKLPHELSGGQRQRVMIARALMLEPRLLIADEPTSMLDASLRVSILNLLTDIRDKYKMTVMFITHDLGQASYISDRVLVMYRGRLVEEGIADDVLWNPQHDYTRQLLADVPTLHPADSGFSSHG
jgi:peptide/nickel transport system ATP-binding protein